MARSKNRNHSKKRPFVNQRRVVISNTKRPSLPDYSNRPYLEPLREKIKTIESRPSRRVTPKQVMAAITNPRIVFPDPMGDAIRDVVMQSPLKAIVCAKRQIRKEVLHAFRKTGKTGQKRPRRTEHSDIQC